MRVEIDHERCLGHGRCAALCPEVFDLDDSGLGVVLAPDVPTELSARVIQAEMNCPEGAVRVTERAAQVETRSGRED